MLYLLVCVLLLCLSIHYDINGKTKYRNNWYIIILIIFVLVAGLRYRLGVDTHRYLYNFYHEYPSLEDFSLADYQIGDDPFYVLLNSIIRFFGGRFYMLQLIQAAFVNILILNYFKKHSKYVFTCAFFYFSISYIGLMMEILRASFSIAICLYANDYIRERKWAKGYLLYFIATLFHSQTLVLCVLPLLFFLKLNKKGIIILILSYFVGVLLANSLGDYVFLFEGNESIEGKVSGYAESEIYGKNTRNLGFYIVSYFPMVVLPIFSLWYCKRFCGNKMVKALEPFVMIGVIFLMIQATFFIAYRYVDYYKLYFELYFAETFVCMIRNNNYLKHSLSCARSLLIFLPLLIVSVINFFDYRYNPYSSVLDKTVVEGRENRFQKLGIDLYFPPRPNEY